MLYHECVGYDCEWRCCCLPRAGNSKLDREISSDRCSLRWSRDEVARHCDRLILFRSVQPCLLLTVTQGNRGLGLGELTFLQLSTTYTPVIAGRSVGYVLLGRSPPYALSERFRQTQIFCIWNGCRWARRRIPLVGASKPWCAARRGVVISKSSPIHHCAFLITTIS